MVGGDRKAEPLVSFRKVPDGLSKTMLVGEAVTDFAKIEELSPGSSNGYPGRESPFGSRKDHWYIGSDSIDGGGGCSNGTGDPSEALGSTGVPPNLHKQPRIYFCEGNGLPSPECSALNLSFSSEHPGIVQVVMCDGSVQSIPQDIDAIVWSKMGTRSEDFDLVR